MLTPGRYVGAQAQEEDGEPFKDKMQRLTGKLAEQFRSRRGLRRRFGQTCWGWDMRSEERRTDGR